MTVDTGSRRERWTPSPVVAALGLEEVARWVLLLLIRDAEYDNFPLLLVALAVTAAIPAGFVAALSGGWAGRARALRWLAPLANAVATAYLVGSEGEQRAMAMVLYFFFDVILLGVLAAVVLGVSALRLLGDRRQGKFASSPPGLEEHRR